MAHPAMAPSHHEEKLAKSSGLLELHYNTMRKRQQDIASRDSFVKGPTMGRNFTAAVGYSGFIPGKMANNVIGCTFAQSSRLSKELRPLPSAGSGVLFTLGKKSSSLPYWILRQSLATHIAE